jgi:hypothetical protein
VLNNLREREVMAIVKADDYKCCKCGGYLKDLITLHQTKNWLKRAELQEKIYKKIVILPKGLYRHKRKCC